MRAIASAGLLLAVVLLSAEAAMACSCAPIDPNQGAADSEGAVTARLLEVERPDDDPVSSAAPTDFVYRTGRVVKGAERGLGRGRRLVVRSALSEVSCGLSGEVGELTGLFLEREDGRWTSGLCSQISRARMLRVQGPDATSSSCRKGTAKLRYVAHLLPSQPLLRRLPDLYKGHRAGSGAPGGAAAEILFE